MSSQAEADDVDEIKTWDKVVWPEVDDKISNFLSHPWHIFHDQGIEDGRELAPWTS